MSAGLDPRVHPRRRRACRHAIGTGTHLAGELWRIRGPLVRFAGHPPTSSQKRLGGRLSWVETGGKRQGRASCPVVVSPVMVSLGVEQGRVVIANLI
jgi:hypothetical protein